MKKEAVIQLPPDPVAAVRLMRAALEKGLYNFICDPSILPADLRKRATIYSDKEGGDILLAPEAGGASRSVAISIMIKEASDIEQAIQAAQRGAAALILDTEDWKIIPLENLVARLVKSETKTFARVSSIEEAEAILHVLEKGVSGLVFKAESEDQLSQLAEVLSTIEPIELGLAEVTEVLEAGLGDRVCVDTTSMLNMGQGALVGSRANFLFLVHNECMGSQFTSPRPFRVNAGAVHSYLLLPGFKTKYLSEVEAGDRILIVDKQGRWRVVAVGRAKIERRPLKIVKARSGEEEGSIAVQNAETISLVGEEGQLLSATRVKKGDKVLAYVTKPVGRHFGLAVEEFVIEK